MDACVFRQALANALAKAPSMWALGNSGMGALQVKYYMEIFFAGIVVLASCSWYGVIYGCGIFPQRLAGDSSPAIAAAASRAIYKLNKKWEIEEGYTRGKRKY